MRYLSSATSQVVGIVVTPGRRWSEFDRISCALRSRGSRKMAQKSPYLKQRDGNGSGLRVGYTVDDQEHDKQPLDPGLPLLQHADLEDKIVLLRVDHNVVKKGQIYHHTTRKLCSYLNTSCNRLKESHCLRFVNPNQKPCLYKRVHSGLNNSFKAFLVSIFACSSKSTQVIKHECHWAIVRKMWSENAFITSVGSRNSKVGIDPLECWERSKVSIDKAMMN